TASQPAPSQAIGPHRTRAEPISWVTMVAAPKAADGLRLKWLISPRVACQLVSLAIPLDQKGKVSSTRPARLAARLSRKASMARGMATLQSAQPSCGESGLGGRVRPAGSG